MSRSPHPLAPSWLPPSTAGEPLHLVAAGSQAGQGRFREASEPVFAYMKGVVGEYSCCGPCHRVDMS